MNMTNIFHFTGCFYISEAFIYVNKFRYYYYLKWVKLKKSLKERHTRLHNVMGNFTMKSGKINGLCV